MLNNEAFDNRPDLAANDTATVMLDEYLRGFDNNGWLISSVDKSGYNEIINEPELPDQFGACNGSLNFLDNLLPSLIISGSVEVQIKAVFR